MSNSCCFKLDNYICTKIGNICVLNELSEIEWATNFDSFKLGRISYMIFHKTFIGAQLIMYLFSAFNSLIELPLNLKTMNS